MSEHRDTVVDRRAQNTAPIVPSMPIGTSVPSMPIGTSVPPTPTVSFPIGNPTIPTGPEPYAPQPYTPRPQPDAWPTPPTDTPVTQTPVPDPGPYQPSPPFPAPLTPPVPASSTPTPATPAVPVIDPILEAIRSLSSGGSGIKAPTITQPGGAVYQASAGTAANPMLLIVGIVLAGGLVVWYLQSKKGKKSISGGVI